MSGLVAVFSIQADDANHLILKEKGLYIRLKADELRELLSGRVPEWVYNSCFSGEVRRQYEEFAALFRRGEISKLVVESYPGVEPMFRYEVEPSKIEIYSRGFLEKMYVLDLDDKKVYITVSVLELKVSVNEYPKHPKKEEKAKQEAKASTVEIPVNDAMWMVLTLTNIAGELEKKRLSVARRKKLAENIRDVAKKLSAFLN